MRLSLFPNSYLLQLLLLLLPPPAIMAAATSCSPALSAASETLAKPITTRSFATTNLALQSPSSKLGFKTLTLRRRAAGGGSALAARMVSAPAQTIKPPASLDFDTSVFNKEKINLAGHDEVFSRYSLKHFLFLFLLKLSHIFSDS